MFKGNTLNKLVAGVVFFAAALFAGQQLTTDSTTDSPSLTEETNSSAETIRFSNLPAIDFDELPSEAFVVLERIENDETHPYSKDGSTFQNREGILPDQSIGHYQEFTVETPGSSDRGARRIVTGSDGERFYTADHYGSFSEIID